jgi:hypothetical protein
MAPQPAGRLCTGYKVVLQPAGRLCIEYKMALQSAGRLCTGYKMVFLPYYNRKNGKMEAWRRKGGIYSRYIPVSVQAPGLN